MAQVYAVTLEEHFTSKAIADEMTARGEEDPMSFMPAAVLHSLAEVGAERVASMDESNVRMQIVSHTPSQRASVEAVRAANDELAACVRAYPDRFRGFAQLPMGHPKAAAAELERTVSELGFVGALVDNHTLGQFYDGPDYDVFWETAQRLGVPIYLHPTFPSEQVADLLYRGGGLEGRSLESMSLGSFALGWHADTGLHVLRLVAARVFERFPRLKIVIGHCGELLPFVFQRCARAAGLWGLQRSWQDIISTNLWITTSGMFDLAALRCLLAHMPPERVLFSIDYPFSTNATGRAHLRDIEESGILADVGSNLDAFAHGNAEKLLGISL